MNKNITKAFHPGFYLKEYLEELQMTQDEFAKRLGISGKQLSLILNETASITADIAYKLSRLMNTSVEMWLNLQTKYDAYCIEIKNIRAQDIDEMFTVTVIDENGNSGTVTYGALTYVRNIINVGTSKYSQELIDTVRSLYLYNQATQSYVESKS